MKIYITRHSKTIWNTEKRLQGRLDSPLTKVGIENAKALKEYIKDMSFDCVYSSPIARAYNTAALIFDENRIIKDDRLMEMNFGDYEGVEISKLKDDPLYYQLWHQPESFTCIPHGESYDDVIKRVHDFTNDLIKDNKDHVFIVTHGMYFIVFICTLLGLDKKDFVLYNQKVVDGCSLTCIDYTDGKFTLEFYNECSFLPHVSNESFAK